MMNGKLITNKVVCEYHPYATLIEEYSAGDMICPECGLVVGDRVIDVNAEWRTFTNDDPTLTTVMNRVGGHENPLMSGSDLTTKIGPATGAASVDSTGEVKYRNRPTNVNFSNQCLRKAYAEISEMAEKLHMPEVIVNRAQYLYKDVYDTEQLRGRTIYSKAAACLYISCRQECAPRTFKEICAVSSCGKNSIGRAFSTILKLLKTTVDLISTGDFMTRFCANLDLPKPVVKAATHIARTACTKYLVNGRSPISVAAASIYMASQASTAKKTREEIADIAGVVADTIDQSYKLMYPYAAILFPSGFEFDTPISMLPMADKISAKDDPSLEEDKENVGTGKVVRFSTRIVELRRNRH